SFEQATLVADRHPPLGVVVLAHQVVGVPPGRPHQAIVTEHRHATIIADHPRWQDRGLPAACSSGVVRLAGRVPATDPRPLLSSGLTLDGAALPLAGRARIYTCGITPYDVTHLGHAATFVWSDLLASVVRAAGVEPEVCRNVTDVDDVLTAA